jgi:hypothetical protein
VLLVPLSPLVELLVLLVNGVLVTPENAHLSAVLEAMELPLPPAEFLIPICALAEWPPTLLVSVLPENPTLSLLAPMTLTAHLLMPIPNVNAVPTERATAHWS